MINLKNTENELIELLNQDRQNWVQIYRLMEQVEKEKAYRESANNFTQWVNKLANKAKVHVSLLWARKKAGSAYDAYMKRMEAKGVQATPLEELKVSPDNLNLVAKIAGSNDEVADDLINKVANNELHRSDLKQAWNDVKEERIKNGMSPTRKSRFDESVERSLDTTKLIQLSLLKNSDWLVDIIEGENESFDAPIYKALPELSVRTGSSNSARRIDVAVMETYTNCTIKGDHDLSLHGIEIKISRSDLYHDNKMQEYTGYCDYFWIAVPEGMIEDAKEYALDEWGILAYYRKEDGSGEIKCIKKAEKLDAPMREFALVEAIRRRLK